MITQEQLKHNIEYVEKEIAQALLKVGRTREDLLLVAVTKAHSVELLKMAINCGLTCLGENKAQEAMTKQEVLGDTADWHFIGHVQRNKVKYIAGRFSLLHSVDSISLAKELEKQCTKKKVSQDILIQVNTSGEESKFGVQPHEVISLIREVSKNSYLKIKGLMTIGRLTDETDEIRGEFRMLKNLFDEIKALELPLVNMSYLSMGMTHDYKIAIEEGANIIRIGTALFGDRNYI